MRADLAEDQVVQLTQALRLPDNWREMIKKQSETKDSVDPEIERRELRATMHLMRENFEKGLCVCEEYIYWQKVNAIKEKIEMLSRVRETAIDQAASGE